MTSCRHNRTPTDLRIVASIADLRQYGKSVMIYYFIRIIITIVAVTTTVRAIEWCQSIANFILFFVKNRRKTKLW